MEVKFDQHFMRNKEILNLIIKTSKIKKTDKILEIGPGPGYLTQEILEKNPKSLTSIEIDPNFENNLKKIKNENFELIFGNGLNFLNKVEYNKLIANIPYSITEPLYKKLMFYDVDFAVIMHGEKFYKLIQSKESKWHYYVNSFYNIKLIKEIKGEEFEPKTKVNSVILELNKKEPSKEEKLFQNLFLREERNVRNALIFSYVETYKLTKSNSKEKIDSMLIPIDILNKKLENLSNEEFLKLVDKIYN